jgi:hypothetical protein
VRGCFYPCRTGAKHALRTALLPLSSAKLNPYFERGSIPQKGSNVE